MTRSVIVTGGGSGIGLATVKRFHRDGLAVLAVDRVEDGLTRLAQEFSDDRLATLCIDVTLKDAPARIVEAACDRFGYPEILVNNAGIGHAYPVADTEDADLDLVLDVNIRSMFRLARAFLAKAVAGAAVVNTSSVFGMMPTAGGGAYSVAKAAVIGLTKQLAAEYGPKGIRANAVAPGVIATPLIADRIDGERFRRMIIETVPFNRIGAPEDIASAIAFLASNEQAGFINGHVLVIDGGWTAVHHLPEAALSSRRVPENAA